MNASPQLFRPVEPARGNITGGKFGPGVIGESFDDPLAQTFPGSMQGSPRPRVSERAK